MKVSVLMPVYNGASYLQEAIDSILNQTYHDFELIIVDDGSKDESAAIIARNAAKDSRIVALRNEKNSGICVTLNKGLHIARGEYIVRMDCDDISLPKRIERQVAFMDEHPEVGVSGMNILIFGEGISDRKFDFSFTPVACKADMLFYPCLAHPAAIMRKTALQQLDMYYDDYYRGMEDFDLWWRLSLVSKISNMPERLLKYRIHATQETQKKSDETFKLKIRKHLEYRLNGLNIKLQEDEVLILFKYLDQDAIFDDNDLICFIKTGQHLLKSIKKTDEKLGGAMRTVIAKAISAIIDSDRSELKRSSFLYHTLSFINGCFPFFWYVKRVGNSVLTKIKV